MAKILIVDDEESYCDELTIGLNHDGHEVMTALTPQGAIAVGALFRPDVLISDWMLKRKLNGLDVSEALALVNPDLRSILITGFASADLRNEAAQDQFSCILEKPFRLVDIRSAVHDALAEETPVRSLPGIPVCEIDSEGEIIFANSVARELFSETFDSDPPNVLFDMFTEDALDELGNAIDRWVEVRPLGCKADEEEWSVRATRFLDCDSTLLVFLDDSRMSYVFDPRIYRLLGIESPPLVDVDLDGHFLIVSDNTRQRNLVASVLNDSHFVCHSASEFVEALKLLKRDPDVKCVVIDYHVTEHERMEFIEQVRLLRPDAKIVRINGAGYNTHRLLENEFVLARPWDVNDVVNVLAQST